MTRVTIAVATVLSVCVAAAQTAEGVSAGIPSGEGSVSGPDSISDTAGLVSVVQLNEGQLENLRRLNVEFEDELFPLMQDSWEKEWELRRLYRSKNADESRGDMIRQEIEALYERIRNVGVRNRERARALLSSQQISALGRLETLTGEAVVARACHGRTRLARGHSLANTRSRFRTECRLQWPRSGPGMRIALRQQAPESVLARGGRIRA